MQRTIGGSGGGHQASPHPGSKFFNFHAVFGKNLNNNPTLGVDAHLRKILDPPLGTVLELVSEMP